MNTLTQNSTTSDVVNNLLPGVGNYSDGINISLMNESVENLFTEVENNSTSMCIGGDKIPLTKEAITEIENIDLLFNNKTGFELSDEEIKLLKPHRKTRFIPKMTTTEEEGLLHDIMENGFRDVITITKDMEIIDGRTRIEMFKRERIPHKPKFIYFQNDESDVLDFIMSKNISRRHLTQGQKAISALILNDIVKEENKIKISRKMQAFKDSVQWLDDEENANENGINSRKQAAKFFGISPSYIGKAKAVKKSDNALFLKVHAGDVSLENAYSQIKQKEAILPLKSTIEDFQNEYGKTEIILKPLINLLANLGIPENDAQKIILHKFNKEQDEYLKWEKKSDDAKFKIYLKEFKAFMKIQLPDTNEYSAIEARLSLKEGKKTDALLNLAEKIAMLMSCCSDEQNECLQNSITETDRKICRHSGKQMINDIIIKFLEEISECSNAKES